MHLGHGDAELGGGMIGGSGSGHKGAREELLSRNCLQ